MMITNKAVLFTYNDGAGVARLLYLNMTEAEAGERFLKNHSRSSFRGSEIIEFDQVLSIDMDGRIAAVSTE